MHDDSGLGILCLLLFGWLVSVAIAVIIFKMGVKDESQRKQPVYKFADPKFIGTSCVIDRAIPIVDCFKAGCFICEECGQRSYFDLITAGTDLLLWPKIIECQHCSSHFGILDPDGHENIPQVE